MTWRFLGRRLPRINGLSGPIGGVQWENKPTEAQIVKKLFALLEDRRVLYEPSHAEVPGHCAHSILKLRELLALVGQDLGHEGVLYEQVRALSAACRKFLGRMNYDDPAVIRDTSMDGHWRSWQFQDALGQLRGIFGVHIAVMADRFGVEVPDELKPILPEAPFEDELNA